MLAGVVGGLVVLILGAILIATDVIDTGDTEREVINRQAPISRPGNIAPSDKGGDLTVNEIYDRDGPGVVFIQRRVNSGEASPLGGQGSGEATGSGFVLDKDGYVLTNAHVVEGAGNGDVQVRFGEEDSFEADVVGPRSLERPRAAEGQGAEGQVQAAPARRLRDARSVTRPSRSATPSVSTAPLRPDRVRPPTQDRCAQRLLDQQRHPDRRLDQPRQLRRASDRRRRQGHRHQLPDRHRRFAGFGRASASPSRSTRPSAPSRR